ncbi:ABC transporter substrate-binding protein [Roseomonas sp. SSH11]|uniref:ABC transporter substrate-binding protein n=1 Tax=Pararoseomonas baculiformis TaxID=2820812 RepID=A0ABS4AL98_9PROT|nr:ABC transporter substrate-binding protein [Pararoseomonas baculiformis]MBP0447295.1 ABC transporter substrate-binding protein [Pararoseomonas baculiformis]
MRRSRLALLGLFAGLWAGAATAQTLRVGIVSDPDVLDPTLSRSLAARQVFAAMCDKLIEVDADLRLVPQLATAWRWEDEGRRLVLTLRPDVRFHDGAAMDAEAVVTGLRRHLETPGSTRRGEMGPVKEVVATGPLEVTIRLEQPFAPLLAALSDRAGMIVSPRAAGRVNQDFAREPACAGPFRFTRRVAQDRIELERFPEYWDAGRIHFDRVVYRPITDSTVMSANLRSGTIELAERVAATDLPELRADRRVQIASVPSLNSVYIAVNVANGPRAETPLGRDRRVREALELAIDRAALVQVAFDGQYLPGNQSVSPSSPNYVKSLPVPGRDLARARALLREAGFTDRVKMRMSVPNTSEYSQAAEIIQAMAAEAGIDVELQVIETATLLRQWTSGDFESLLIAWSGRLDLDGNLWGFNACGESLNGGKYCSQQADAALREGRSSVDPAQRAAAYERAMRVLLADRPYIYLWHSRILHGASSRLEGLKPVPDGLIRLQGVRLRG